MGSPGTGRTDLYIENKLIVAGAFDPNDVNVSGCLTAANDFRLYSPSNGYVTAGVVTAYTRLQAGSNASKFNFTGNQLGIGTATPRCRLDVEGRIRMTTSSENVHPLDISSNNVDVDLSKGQSFTLTVDSAISQFTLLNPPDDATTFTIKILQNATGYSVGINTFKDSSGNSVDVYWPAGGVVPIVTQDANKTDIYSFKTFDSGGSLYGVVGGQNFVA